MLIVLTTVQKKSEGEKIAKSLVEKHLAACVNIVKLERSIYRWEGKIKEDGEYLLIIKTSDRSFLRLEREIKNLSTYDMPEILAIKTAKGSKRYIDWVNHSCLSF
ncbi:MAG: divalent-cation tolerance protein CutA [Candidatus Micrarchaeia archaeon]|jgi:periplasmic divalent cation tolerance protein